MHALERRRRILEFLQAEPFLSVEHVTNALQSSPATIRRDFAELSAQGLVVRGHGGIHRLDNAPITRAQAFPRPKNDQADGKGRIAAAAAKLLEDGQIVIIDGGTTTLNLAYHLTSQVRVITNSLPLASLLGQQSNDRAATPEVSMPGGFVYPRSQVLLGPQTVKALRDYNADWTFISADGIMPDGIFNSNNLIVDTQRMMIERAEKVVILVDASKLYRPAMMKVCPLERVQYIITDKAPPAVLADACRKSGVEVIVA